MEMVIGAIIMLVGIVVGYILHALAASENE
jgi:hypothetical protein